MKGFEIHTYRDGRWRIDSIFDDQELALFEAKRVEECKRYAGVLVIEEDYDPATNRTNWRTIFRSGRFANRLWGDLYAKQRQTARAETMSRRRKENLSTVDRKPRTQTRGGFIKPLVILAIIVAGGIAAMIALRQIFLPS